jgi:glycosyltransferase involved in cell wall biosynthesis
LISDDSSGDDVERVVSKWLFDKRVRYTRNPNPREAGSNRDYLIRCSDGEYIKFVFDDDFLFPYSLDTLVRAADMTKAAIAFHGRIVIDAFGIPLEDWTWIAEGSIAHITGIEVIQNVLRERKNLIGESFNSLIRREILEEYPNSFDFLGYRLMWHTDVALYLDLAAAGFTFCGLGVPGSAFRRHQGQYSSGLSSALSAGLFEWEMFLRWGLLKGFIDADCYLAGMKSLPAEYQESLERYPELEKFLSLDLSSENSSGALDDSFLGALNIGFRSVEERLS